MNDTLRYPACLTAAVMVALLLFWIMQLLIVPPRDGFSRILPKATMEIIDVKPQPEQETEPQRLQAAAASPPPPGVPSLSRPRSPTTTQTTQFDIQVPDIDVAGQLPAASGFGESFGGFAGDGGTGTATGGYGDGRGSGTEPLIPLSTARPKIPEYACEQGIEGWVEAVFVVGRDGKVSNIRIIDARPRGIFEQPMVESLSGWIYQTRSSAVEVTQRVEMKLEDCAYNW